MLSSGMQLTIDRIKDEVQKLKYEKDEAQRLLTNIERRVESISTLFYDLERQTELVQVEVERLRKIAEIY